MEKERSEYRKWKDIDEKSAIFFHQSTNIGEKNHKCLI